MKTVLCILGERVSAAMAEVAGGRRCAAIVRPTTDPKFGDYQANGVMGLAKQLKTNPRKLAEQVVARLDVSDICEPPEVAGPGFINLRLKADHVAGRLRQISEDAGELRIDKAEEPATVVVDFSSPNIAKEMFVGHLRSTIIGDCICRLLECLGHSVIRQNHIGDWGTQFGRVILGLWHMCMAERRKNNGPLYYRSELGKLKACADEEETLKAVCRRIRDRHETDWREDSEENLGDGQKIFKPFLMELRHRDTEDLWDEFLCAYQYVSTLEDLLNGLGLMIPTAPGDQEETIPYESLSRRITVMLQEGGEGNEQEKLAWTFIRGLTLDHCQGIYERLGVTLTRDDVRGESAYREDLPGVVRDLAGMGVAAESDGAVCVFPDGFKNKEGEPLPFIIQKGDGAHLYATTDLAAVRYRVGELKADEIVYVTDARQNLHFDMLFKVAEMAGWNRRDGNRVELVHVTFGSVLGENGKPLKTREGQNVKLKGLLDEAVDRAMAVVEEKNPDLADDEKQRIARAVGIGAVKYADYSNNRDSDYIFSFDKMLAMDGNTAPYMQYAYARIRSIERKADDRGVNVAGELAGLGELNLTERGEIDLAKHLIRYGEAVEAAAGDYRPNYLTSYLYELAQKFSVFYTNCPVLDARVQSRPTRLLLCDLTARTIKHGLSSLLGIEVVEQM